jgi:hypothetical protein
MPVEQRKARRQNTGKARGLSSREALTRVARELPRLLGRPIESAIGLEHDGDGGWEATVQVVELARVPPTTDVLGSYRVKLDRDGELISYRRTRRYYRNQADED